MFRENEDRDWAQDRAKERNTGGKLALHGYMCSASAKCLDDKNRLETRENYWSKLLFHCHYYTLKNESFAWLTLVYTLILLKICIKWEWLNFWTGSWEIHKTVRDNQTEERKITWKRMAELYLQYSVQKVVSVWTDSVRTLTAQQIDFHCLYVRGQGICLCLCLCLSMWHCLYSQV